MDGRSTGLSPRPGQAFSPYFELWVSCFSYQSGKGGDAWVAVGKHNSWIWILFHILAYGRDGILSLLHPFGFFSPLVLWTYAMNGNQQQEEKNFLVFWMIFLLKVWPADQHHLNACGRYRISSPTQNKWIRISSLTRNQVVPIPRTSPLKEPEAWCVTLRSHCSCHPPEWSQEWNRHNLHDKGFLPGEARMLGGEK